MPPPVRTAAASSASAVPTWRRAMPTAAVAAAMALAVAGCSAGQQQSSPGSAAAAGSQSAGPAAGLVLAQSLQQLIEAGSATVTGTLGTVNGGHTTEMRLDGAVQWQPDVRSEFTITGMTVLGLDLGTVQLRAVDGTVYLHAALLTSRTGSYWVTLPPSLTRNLPLEGKLSVDPAVVATALKSAEVRLAGPDTADGTPAQHYFAMIGAPPASSAASAPAAVTALLPPGTRVDLWIGTAKGLPVRIALDSPAESADLHFSAYGQPVDVAVPPSDQVADGASAAP